MLLRTTTSATRVVTNAPSATAPGRLTGPPVSPNLYQELQREITALRQLIGQNHDEVLENFLEVLKQQQQTMDRIALLQKRMEASIAQVYELHEYPIPRLFIILPDNRHRWDPRRLLSNRFRLHFLCECGEHTRELVRDDPTLSRQPHHLHLAHHGGYELTRASEFFDQYGPYLLGMLQMIKFGCVVAGMVIPPLAHLPAMDQLQGVSQTVHVMSKDLVAGVDASIQYLERHLQVADGDPMAIYDRLSELSALEGADLRRLEHFIRRSDEGRTLGNLYRITTLSGHVKWVCLDHYRSNYRESAIRQLLQCVEVNGGVYDAHLQKITITLGSPTVASQFMDRLVSAPGVDELEIGFDYDFSSADLTQLRQVLRSSSVQSLKLDGHWRKGPLVEIKLPGKKRYDGVIGMMAHERLRCLKIRRLIRFGTNLSSSVLVPIASTSKSGSNNAGSRGSGNSGSNSSNSSTSGTALITPGSGSVGTMRSANPTFVLRPNAISFLRILHFLERLDEEDQDRLATIIQGSPSLVDLQLGLPNDDIRLADGMANATILSQKLLDAIATLPFLNILHMYMVHIKQPTHLSLQALQQIASYGTLQECKVIVYNAFSFAAQFSVLARSTTQHTTTTSTTATATATSKKLVTFQLQAIALWRVGHFEKMQATSVARRSSSVHLDFPDHAMTAQEIQAVRAILSGFELSYLSIAMPTDLKAASRNVIVPLEGAIDHSRLTSVRFSRLARGVHGQFWVAFFASLRQKCQHENQQQQQWIQLTKNIEDLGIQDKEKARLSLQTRTAVHSLPAVPTSESPFRKLKSISLVQAHISTHLLEHIGELSLCQLTLFYCSIEGDMPMDTVTTTINQPRKLASTLIQNLDYSRLRLMVLVELGMDSSTVEAFRERVCEYRPDLDIYVYDTEWKDLDVEQLSTSLLVWSKRTSSTPRSPQAVCEGDETNERHKKGGAVDTDDDDSDETGDSVDARTTRKHFTMCARNKSNFDPAELNSFYAKMKLY
ncbi:hypothetical protein DFQ27_009941 [Actinomortierella ambigua]|uniref:Uncharacterized protein n=1 Tax=Actinomortierella ambigua TaxID=1343610 RepID=A0A9P6PPP9_9FUNG|nr:hypothetical protein DFQ27_009941 [Actinomortierella ambigua]